MKPTEAYVTLNQEGRITAITTDIGELDEPHSVMVVSQDLANALIAEMERRRELLKTAWANHQNASIENLARCDGKADAYGEAIALVKERMKPDAHNDKEEPAHGPEES